MKSVSISDLSILLVEPSLMQRKIILSMLEESGAQKIEGVGSAEEALIRLQTFIPDLVISNLYSGEMTGADLVMKLRQSEKMEHIPFMLISSENRFKALDPVRQAGVVAILPKPFEIKALKRALAATVDFIEAEELDLEHYDIEDIRVLLVDDSNTARKHIARVLESLGVKHITTANNGKEASKLIDESIFDLIVTDYNMPEMDGEALIQHIRQNTHLSHVPILMVTSESNNARLANIQQEGMSAVCDKPFEPQDVRSTLARLLSE
ncbi:MAG: response regulator [Pseudomonadota bacterium]